MSASLWATLVGLKNHQWIDLTHEFGPETPKFDGFPAAKFETLFDHNDGFLVKQITLVGQYGTHLDPPIHFAKGGRYLNDLNLMELVLPLVVIDLSEKVRENPDYVLSQDDVRQWEEKYGEIPAGSFVAFRSDWSKRWPDHDKCHNRDANGDAHYPGWSLEALKFLYEERKITANGHETFDTDAPVNQRTSGFVAEDYVLANDHYQVEVLANLDKVPAMGAIIFCMVPRAKEAPSFPARVFAILP